jgi:heterodisulfide reductase subunit A-like polyferredoxin
LYFLYILLTKSNLEHIKLPITYGTSHEQRTFVFKEEGQERKMLPRLKQTLQSLKRTATISKAQAIKNLSTQIKKEDVPTEKLDCVVIGAGVVGIAIARELASKGREVLVLDSASTFGTGTSSRNSEVIHAGIYYPPDSLKVTPHLFTY